MTCAWQGGNSLLARAAAVVHEDDRARPGVPEDRLDDAVAARLCVVLGVDVPADRLEAPPIDERRGLRRLRPAWRPEQAWGEVGFALDEGAGLGELLGHLGSAARGVDVRESVIADEVALADLAP